MAARRRDSFHVHAAARRYRTETELTNVEGCLMALMSSTEAEGDLADTSRTEMKDELSMRMGLRALRGMSRSPWNQKSCSAREGHGCRRRKRGKEP
jgi:hypothetical protein